MGGIEDHVHLLIEAPKDIALSDLVRSIKTSGTHWLKTVDISRFKDFEWQKGYGAFTASLTTIEAIKNYIQNQEEHHKTRTFQEEWAQILSKN